MKIEENSKQPDGMVNEQLAPETKNGPNACAAGQFPEFDER
jgi:hypothetical protein